MRVLPRGNWLDDRGRSWCPACRPRCRRWTCTDRRATRLDLARWLVARDNPLVARVMVNRLWKLAFGQGLVTTLDDFGSQGAWPTHPELLDWLAVEFVDGGWDVKAMLKRMVMSADLSPVVAAPSEPTASSTRPIAGSRGRTRFRLDAELIRDNALAVSGLLSAEIGGPSVKPYQPPGYWVFLNFPTREYQPDHGDEPVSPRPLHLLAADVPASQPAGLRRLDARGMRGPAAAVEHAAPGAGPARTTRPTSRPRACLAARLIREGGTDPSAPARPRLPPGPVPAAAARRGRGPAASSLARHERAVPRRLRRGRASCWASAMPRPAAGIDPAELAAWTSVTRVILNLHETITRN